MAGKEDTKEAPATVWVAGQGFWVCRLALIYAVTMEANSQDTSYAL